MFAFVIPEAQTEKKTHSKPTGRKTPAGLRTAQKVILQLWQEFQNQKKGA